MPVRKIGINSRSITGRHGFSGQQFESSLERDLLDLLAFDFNVDRVESQPLQIIYLDSDGKIHRYTPDFLITYRRDIIPARDMAHLLVEVKYREDYRGQFRELKQRLRAARLYAKEQGWQFKVLTENEIRTPYLDNARFLRPYREVRDEPELEYAVLRQIEQLRESTPAMLIESLADSEYMRLRYLTLVWKLVANIRIGTDLMRPLNMRSRIWYQG